ncbi:MAG: phosphonate C-P lyase system protein PhnG [Sulfitobacter litoralis]|jgi:alpha-D-ribose 1-methylphosphonate 5-triphosphate synthase subunit PhnG|uniref:Alpha-D-ribose 1-methylphosphonate 5-triphosphate synthase subunit PhnG n=3 Tax=Roseobacteraceae TaxID=2854170 RepID=A0ABY0RIW9_9RHOB|nr:MULTISPECIES: phosphonate C-P lyase system protein PhnG [Sulfitobacter]MBQ0717093.1 phosphonate C-P lyase system protein PhnG [Sulfitobacter litoralis]MBQ0766417.1 phosphonate C-P lyase system protein PhnG [Sulfitobacter litoralis]MCF7727088.1 phosphonate C-P lyase system protein PhnG [Sulfitobacter sp. M22]MCF7778465.1 phosphonate C-P lyase system protein PhnG [Sulfitobacter sp. M220]SDO15357.1 alpha-D-ribose 1-methylphosphonate 5-triphosphate synthase subunit PhnG [Sulfitobacter litoralis|tara:strand:+ start:64 stop:528 length:465 start_codon:yes stop_codon:yes gene_type:complete
MNMMNSEIDPNAPRKSWLGLLAKSPAAEIARLWTAYDTHPDHSILRAPEIGGVMVRGRAGAVGAAFNLGEMSVTRASVKLGCGTVGHGYVQGRSKDHALQTALIDALMQTEAATQVEAAILAPLRKARDTAKATRAAKAAATKVDFFTMVRGED